MNAGKKDIFQLAVDEILKNEKDSLSVIKQRKNKPGINDNGFIVKKFKIEVDGIIYDISGSVSLYENELHFDLSAGHSCKRDCNCD